MQSDEMLARARKLFSEEDIRLCLRDLQEFKEGTGLELDDFISVLESIVQSS